MKKYIALFFLFSLINSKDNKNTIEKKFILYIPYINENLLEINLIKTKIKKTQNEAIVIKL